MDKKLMFTSLILISSLLLPWVTGFNFLVDLVKPNWIEHRDPTTKFRLPNIPGAKEPVFKGYEDAYLRDLLGEEKMKNAKKHPDGSFTIELDPTEVDRLRKDTRVKSIVEAPDVVSEEEDPIIVTEEEKPSTIPKEVPGAILNNVSMKKDPGTDSEKEVPSVVRGFVPGVV